MDPYAFIIEELRLNLASARAKAAAFLAARGLGLDSGIRKYYAVYHGDRMVGGGGYEGNVIKCVAVDPEFRGEGLTNALVSRIMGDLRRGGVENVFIFTKPENEVMFSSLGFSRVEATRDVLLLEFDSRGFSGYLGKLESIRSQGPCGAIVMNCNPFTLGHRYLVETAAARCGRLALFVVEEDASVFPFPVRLRLIESGVADLPEVTVVPGGDYIVSAATFPTYFLGDASDAARAHTELDITIFGRRIAPAAGIVARFAGEEPYSPVTRLYNEAMLRVLPALGVGVTVLPRKTSGGEAISASRVRALLAEGRIEETRSLVPPTTYEFLASDGVLPIVEDIRGRGRGNV